MVSTTNNSEKTANKTFQLAIATFNVQNLFSAGSNPVVTKAGYITAEKELVKRRKLILAVERELGLPEILALQEVGDAQILHKLASGLNEAAGTAYQSAAPATSDRRGIRLGFLWDEARVEKEAIMQMSGADVAAAFGQSSPNPGREPLAGLFQIKGRRIMIINNHFKSNFIPEANLHLAEPLLLANAAQRRAQAAVLQAFAAPRLARNPQELLLITGDFNDGSTTAKINFRLLTSSFSAVI